MKKIIIITISIFLLLGIWQTTQATELLLEYPSIETDEGTYTFSGSLPEIIRYIYMFALGAAGFVALLSILIGAIMYVFSAGNPSKAADAKNQILSALLGILILLASVLILGTINPDLIKFGFNLPVIEEVDDIPPEARACFCGGAWEKCYENGQTCREQCSAHCQMLYDLWTTGICNIDANHCP